MLPRCQQDGSMMVLVAKKKFFLHDATTMSTRCQHDVHFKIVYLVTLSFFYQYVSLHNPTTMLKIIFLHDATTMSTRCQHDVHFKIVYLVTLSFFYRYVSLHNPTMMLPRCLHDVQGTLFYLNAYMDCSGWSQALSTTNKTCLI